MQHRYKTKQLKLNSDLLTKNDWMMVLNNFALLLMDKYINKWKDVHNFRTKKTYWTYPGINTFGMHEGGIASYPGISTYRNVIPKVRYFSNRKGNSWFIGFRGRWVRIYSFWGKKNLTSNKYLCLKIQKSRIELLHRLVHVEWWKINFVVVSNKFLKIYHGLPPGPNFLWWTTPDGHVIHVTTA